MTAGQLGLWLLLAAGLWWMSRRRGIRSAALPEVPTFGEAGVKDMIVTNWFGIFGPANLPRPVVERINGGINSGINSGNRR